MTDMLWTRKCQECGHRQVAQKPKSGELTDAYRNAKCQRCRSEALDYGSEGWVKDTRGVLVPRIHAGRR